VKISLVELELEDEEEEGDRLRMEMNGSGNKYFHQCGSARTEQKK
jgi:hypothetical protein